MTRDRVRIGFVSPGMMGQAAHLANYVRLGEDAEVVALAEVRPQLAAAVARRHGIHGVYADADDTDGEMGPAPVRTHDDGRRRLVARRVRRRRAHR